MAGKLQVTELDFDNIKTNLKTYLKDSGLQFELSLFLENSNFLKIELDS